ncbi:hypothetical protein C0991_001025 [Blastosporella zonata]|nr:hypothetical protein C0991_001025 [Blastosporella zonata]
MPVEHIRQQLMRDTALYPEFGGPRKSTNSAIDSSNSDASYVARPIARNEGTPIIISSDEEDESPVSSLSQVPAAPSTVPTRFVPLQPSQSNPTNVRDLTQKVDKTKFPEPAPFKNQPTQLAIPSNRDIIRPSILNHSRPEYEDLIPIVEDPNDYVHLSQQESEKALRELMSGGMDQELENEVDMEDATVKGFREDINMMPTQLLYRADETSVICPLALVGQWADEISKIAEDVSVYKHHGPSRTADPMVLRKHRVVVTTYDVVKVEYDAHQANSAKDESQTKLSKKTPANSSDDDDAGDDFGKTLGTKVKKSKSAKKAAIFGVKWWRIVLDEAHNIKNYKTKGAVACCELQAKFRWCLTGTPMQNHVDELYSLIKFLRIKPLSDLTTFNTQISIPVKKGRQAIRAMKRLQVVLKQIMLRRRKDQTIDGKALIELPKRTVEVISCDFDPSEQVFYNSLENKMESVIEKLMGNGKNNYISVLLLLLRLRQACNHPILVTQDYKADNDALDPKAKKNTDEDDDDDLVGAFAQLGVTRKCQMCTIELNSRNTAPDVTEALCVDCAPLALQAKEAEKTRPSSAKIRMILKLLADIDQRSNSTEKTIIFSQFTKMLDLVEPFLQGKGIEYVRCEFVLIVVLWRLVLTGRSDDGSMDAKAREKALEVIKKISNVRVILISFKAGSTGWWRPWFDRPALNVRTGLNLTACNNVILVDLWWNPALEEQAFDRAHRFGQTRDVNIFKLKIDQTVEDRILALQEKKRELARAALSGDKIKDMGRLGMEDLLGLFRPGGRDDDEEDYE